MFATQASPLSTPGARLPVWPILLAWLVGCFMLAVRLQLHIGDTMTLFGYDDLTRLSEVRDLMAGHGWYDTTQYRYNAPVGQFIHWSRLIDVPIAGLVLLLRPFLGAEADIAAAWVWPLLLLGVMLALGANLSVRLLGREGLLPGLVLPLLLAPVASEFMPGRIDHHNVQAILMLGIVVALVDMVRGSRRGAFWAGLLAAVSIAIGIEGIPFAVGALVAGGLIWVFDQRDPQRLALFGLTLAVAMALLLLAGVPPEHWLTPYCDAISIVFVTAAAGSGLALALVSLLPARTWPLRLAATAVAGSVVAVATVRLFPGCLAGPYAGVDPWLMANWIDKEVEAVSLWTSFLEQPFDRASVLLPLVLAVVAFVVRIARVRADRASWLVVFGFYALAVAITIMQVRGIRLAAPLSIPAGAWLICEARAAYLARGSVRALVGVLGTWLAFGATLVFALLPLPNWVNEASPEAQGQSILQSALRATQCLRPESYAALAALPPATVMASRGIGPYVVGFTAHSVVESPHHRDATGMVDVLHFFQGDDATAREILQRRGATIVALCLDRLDPIAQPPAPNWYTRLQAGGSPPSWLVPLAAGDDPVLSLYAVAP